MSEVNATSPFMDLKPPSTDFIVEKYNRLKATITEAARTIPLLGVPEWGFLPYTVRDKMLLWNPYAEEYWQSPFVAHKEAMIRRYIWVRLLAVFYTKALSDSGFEDPSLPGGFPAMSRLRDAIKKHVLEHIIHDGPVVRGVRYSVPPAARKPDLTSRGLQNTKSRLAEYLGRDGFDFHHAIKHYAKRNLFLQYDPVLVDEPNFVRPPFPFQPATMTWTGAEETGRRGPAVQLVSDPMLAIEVILPTLPRPPRAISDTMNPRRCLIKMVTLTDIPTTTFEFALNSLTDQSGLRNNDVHFLRARLRFHKWWQPESNWWYSPKVWEDSDGEEEGEEEAQETQEILAKTVQSTDYRKRAGTNQEGGDRNPPESGLLAYGRLTSNPLVPRLLTPIPTIEPPRLLLRGRLLLIVRLAQFQPASLQKFPRLGKMATSSLSQDGDILSESRWRLREHHRKFEKNDRDDHGRENEHQSRVHEEANNATRSLNANQPTLLSAFSLPHRPRTSPCNGTCNRMQTIEEVIRRRRGWYQAQQEEERVANEGDVILAVARPLKTAAVVGQSVGQSVGRRSRWVQPQWNDTPPQAGRSVQDANEWSAQYRAFELFECRRDSSIMTLKRSGNGSQEGI
ncbi:hypothetical protein QBC43DRAFT_290193 [Cladorrhinum sp. PSN259]|nr:hypothetical protein QBC43DRAFT_290193 [Cladorrhinum sp. PSN259]